MTLLKFATRIDLGKTTLRDLKSPHLLKAMLPAREECYARKLFNETFSILEKN